jgi:arylsulfatase
MDLPATILNAAGVRHPDTYQGKQVAPLQGKSLDPIMRNERRTVRGPSDWLGWELFGNRAIRQGKWKLLSLCVPHGTGKWQLYDLDNDPGEMNDLSARHPKIKEQLLRYWTEYAAANNVILPDTSPVCTKRP